MFFIYDVRFEDNLHSVFSLYHKEIKQLFCLCSTSITLPKDPYPNTFNNRKSPTFTFPVAVMNYSVICRALDICAISTGSVLMNSLYENSDSTPKFYSFCCKLFFNRSDEVRPLGIACSEMSSVIPSFSESAHVTQTDPIIDIYISMCP